MVGATEEELMMGVVVPQLGYLAEANNVLSSLWLENGSVPNQELFKFFHFINMFCRVTNEETLANTLEFCQINLAASSIFCTEMLPASQRQRIFARLRAARMQA